MRFQFVVGRAERHQVDFSFDQFTGRLVIAVDGAPVVNELRIASVSVTKRYDFAVGTTERHDVAVEKIRPVLFAAFRPSTYKVYVDGALAQTHRG